LQLRIIINFAEYFFDSEQLPSYRYPPRGDNKLGDLLETRSLRDTAELHG